MAPSLADLLLNNGEATRDFTRLPQRTISESTVRRKLRSIADAPHGNRLVLEREEALILSRLLEKTDNDPFANLGTSSFLDVNDMERLGLQKPKGGGESDEIGGDLPDDEDSVSAADRLLNAADGGSRLMANPAGEIIPIEHAIVAPNATPGHEEEIPASVLNSLKVLQSKDQPKELNQMQEPPAAGTEMPEVEDTDIHLPEDPEDSELPSEEESDEILDKKGLTDESILKAFSNIVGNGPSQSHRPASPAPVSRSEKKRLDEASHPSPSDYAAIMAKARAMKQPKTVARTGRRVVEESADPAIRAAVARANAQLNRMGGSQDDSSASIV